MTNVFLSDPTPRRRSVWADFAFADDNERCISPSQRKQFAAKTFVKQCDPARRKPCGGLEVFILSGPFADRKRRFSSV